MKYFAAGFKQDSGKFLIVDKCEFEIVATATKSAKLNRYWKKNLPNWH